MRTFLYWVLCINFGGFLICAEQEVADQLEEVSEEIVAENGEKDEASSEDQKNGQEVTVEESFQQEQTESSEPEAEVKAEEKSDRFEGSVEAIEPLDRAKEHSEPEVETAVQEEQLNKEVVPTIEEQLEEMPEEDITSEALPKEQEEEKIVSIDTMDLDEPQGNWLFKRHWWKRANKIYDHIGQLVDEAFEQRGAFIQKRSELEHELFDPFYLNVGIKQGELRGLISFLLEHIKQDVEDADLSEKEKLLINKLKEHEGIIEQLHRDIQDMSQIDRKVDQAVDKLMEQLSLARSYKKQAWDFFKEIERELSDQRAHEIVFKMRALEKNIKDVINYLKGSFTVFFNALTQTAQDEVERIQFALSELKEKGIDLKEEAQYLELQGQAQPEKSAEQLHEGLFARIWNGITSFFYSIWSTITGWFGR